MQKQLPWNSPSEPLSFEEQERELARRINLREGKVNDCTICLGKRLLYRFDETTQTMVARPCDCLKKKQIEKELQNSGLSPEMRNIGFGDYRVEASWQQQIFQTAQAYAQNPVGWFFIGGQSGSGKTLICTAILTYILGQGTPCKYMLWRDVCNKLKGYQNTERFAKEMDFWKETKVLYIDDLFKVQMGRQPSGGDVNLAFELLNYRYLHQLPTIISTEHTMNQLIAIDEALAGRINQRSQGNRFVISPDSNKNYRLKGIVEL